MTKEEIEKELGYEIEIDGFKKDNYASIFDRFLSYFQLNLDEILDLLAQKTERNRNIGRIF